MQDERLAGVVQVRGVSSQRIPLVFDSPHSGTDYPNDFGHQVDHLMLRSAEDTHVERLFEPMLTHGALMVDALFPRSYIDPNRAKNDLCTDDFADGEVRYLPFDLQPTDKSRRGIGLLWTRAPAQGGLMYPKPLTAAIVLHRIRHYYVPYHARTEAALQHTYDHHGKVLHINCHSMASRASGNNAKSTGEKRPDFVIGDRDGTTCTPEITELLRASLIRCGHSVAINDPYKGVELIRAYSAPAKGRHSVQLEVNRRLYMNEISREAHDGFMNVQSVLERAMNDLAEWASEYRLISG